MTMPEWKRGKKLLLGITGGIAAYKTPELLRSFVRREWDVEIILTEAAEKFVSSFTLSVLAGKRVWTENDFFDDARGIEIPHINLAEKADVAAIAPCTATTLSRLANADGSNLLSAAVLASRIPVLLFPSMNSNMWSHAGVRENVDRCRKLGYKVIEPERGELACRDEGSGRLPSVDVIAEEILKAVCPRKDLEGLKVVVTAGPTHEYLDPVRFISNPSSGRMGFALAKEAWYRGADITVVTGPATVEPPHGVKVIPVVSAEQMYERVLAESADADVIVKAAAVGDYKAATRAGQKMKRRSGARTIELAENPDILAELGKRRSSEQFLVGFAAETENMLENAARKLTGKGADLIVVNDVNAADSGFRSERNTVHVVAAEGLLSSLSGHKDEVAEEIWDIIVARRRDQA